MGVKQLLRTRAAQLLGHAAFSPRSSAVAVLAIGVAAASLGMAEAAVHAGKLSALHAVPELASFTSGPAPRALTLETRTVWEGVDLDGDGQADIANPTGQAPRGTDAYGEGRFHASRDGGSRDHEGVDYVATAGQPVVAPISGYVSKIGYAYPDDQTLRYVEIENPALHLTARVFYVDPDVAVGDAVAVGRPIGHAHSLLKRYRGGMTNHVHLELVNGKGRKLDAETLITARAETVSVAAAD